MAIVKQGITLKALLQNPELLHFNTSMALPKDDKIADGKKSKDVNQVKPAFSGQSAFLGQNVWDKTLPYDPTGDFKDFKLEYMDLDEFLNENSIPTNEELNQLVGELSSQNLPESNNSNSNMEQNIISDISLTTNSDQSYNSNIASPPRSALEQHLTVPIEKELRRQSSDSDVDSSGKSPKVFVEFDVNPQDLELARIPGQNNFDPRKTAFSEEELRPQPIIKKSRKIFVPEDSKDDKYWHRRKKNNVAAKRSREARRIKENQITLRAAYLEKENNTLKSELAKIKEENAKMKNRLSMYE